MVLAISYANERFKPAQKFNSKRALKFGADRVIEYNYDVLPEDFKEKNKELFRFSRGGGYWVWKPFIILDALSQVADGDYVVYTDSGSAFVNKVDYLLEAMNNENTDIMVFSITLMEKYWSKRDAFILMDCDKEEIYNSPQICSGYMIFRKTPKAISFVEQWMHYQQDIRIVSDQPNVMGKDNYEGFQENRHDQTVLSLLSKKNAINTFRDPSEWGLNLDEFSDDIIARSTYPQVIESHRNPQIRSVFQLKYKKWYKYLDVWYYIELIRNIKHKIILKK